MARITFQVIQKPIEQRLIDAACIYYEVDRSYFNKNSVREKSKVVQRRNILYYMIKHNTLFAWKDIAALFGFSSHEPVIEAVENIDAQKNIYQQISNDINHIQAIADKLDAEFIEREITLVNNRLAVAKPL